jgi:hypothetical protein
MASPTDAETFLYTSVSRMGFVAVSTPLATVDAVVETTFLDVLTTGDSHVTVAACPTVLAAFLITFPVALDARSDCS